MESIAPFARLSALSEPNGVMVAKTLAILNRQSSPEILISFPLGIVKSTKEAFKTTIAPDAANETALMPEIVPIRLAQLS